LVSVPVVGVSAELYSLMVPVGKMHYPKNMLLVVLAESGLPVAVMSP
jgi:hypothetical protein